MFVLGIDPGLSRCGYGCVAEIDGRHVAVGAGVITTNRELALPDRLALLRAELVKLIAEFTPGVVVVERVLFQTNARTAMSVGQASGVALLTAAEAGHEVVEYSANEVKLAVAGYGAATKAQVQGMVTRLLALREVPRPPDVADALALALCHLSSSRVSRAMAAMALRKPGGATTVIGALSGQLLELDPTGEIILDVHGVGYQVVIGARHAADLGPLGSAVSLSVHTHVREGAIALYGFPSALERKTFELLLSTHGVGPALALAILGVHSPASLAKAVSSADVDALALVPGVGKKTAQRLVLELAQRLELGEVPSPTGPLARGVQSEVREALAALGYASEEIALALALLPEEGSVEELLREALHELAPRR